MFAGKKLVVKFKAREEKFVVSNGIDFSLQLPANPEESVLITSDLE